MAYLEFKEQLKSHINFLRDMGLDVKQLKINAGFIRTHAIGNTKGRGELSYVSTFSKLESGLYGILTTCLCRGGGYKNHKTYGKEVFFFGNSYPNHTLLPFERCASLYKHKKSDKQLDNQRIMNFWKNSNQNGSSDYLQKKGVGSYGIRFRDNQYGKVAVIPMWSAIGNLSSYQLLNSNGSKVFAKNIRIKGLFHPLKKLKNGEAIGIAESYVTAATCLELTGISVVSAFYSSNLLNVAEIIREKYPDSEIIILAYNDRHLGNNCGVLSALSVIKKLKSKCTLVIPLFEELPIDRSHTDWNDLLRERGFNFAKERLMREIEEKNRILHEKKGEIKQNK